MPEISAITGEIAEKYLNLPPKPQFMAKKEEQSKDEIVGYHKGSLGVLSKEREEMMRILSIVEQLMQMHISELKKLGIDLSKEVEKAKQESAKRKPPIDELL
jgi:hypothetical protein